MQVQYEISKGAIKKGDIISTQHGNRMVVFDDKLGYALLAMNGDIVCKWHNNILELIGGYTISNILKNDVAKITPIIK